MKQATILFFIGVMVAGCGISQRAAPPGVSSGEEPPRAMTVSRVDRYESMRQSLLQAHRDWQGTPYVLGGRSESGVDCSSFVSIVFDRYFGVDLPTNTRRLLNEGEGVRRASVQTGDLVFFRTGRRLLHVGIMVDDEQFLHASTSQGVMISSLTERYWALRYFGARRVM